MKFNDHDTVERPAWLGEAWDDLSYRNDALPHCSLFLTADESPDGPIVECWVNYPEVEDREVPPLYQVIFVREYPYSATLGADDVVLYSGDDEKEAQRFVKAAEVAKTIVVDIIAGPVVTTSKGVKANLLDAKSFSELHDMCDANMLGGQEQFLESCGHTGNDEAADQAALNASVEVLNEAQGIVDLWLVSRDRTDKTGDAK